MDQDTDRAQQAFDRVPDRLWQWNEHAAHTLRRRLDTSDPKFNGTNEAELFISVDRVKENAAKIDIDEETELRRVCIHGLLHLSGLKDKTKEEEEKMRLTENKYLDLLFHVKQA